MLSLVAKKDLHFKSEVGSEKSFFFNAVDREVIIYILYQLLTDLFFYQIPFIPHTVMKSSRVLLYIQAVKNREIDPTD